MPFIVDDGEILVRSVVREGEQYTCRIHLYGVSGEEKWRYEYPGRLHFSTDVLVENWACCIDSESIKLFDRKTGELRWSKRISDRSAAMACADDGQVYFLTPTGVMAIELASKRQRWSVRPGRLYVDTVTAIAVEGDELLCLRRDGTIQIHDTLDGHERRAITIQGASGQPGKDESGSGRATIR